MFRARSGWCGTFCPLGPIQRNYGHAPTLNIPNTLCGTCVGCQKNCFDLNPEAAIFDDLYDEDPRYANQHRIFMAMMPGVIFGYFSQAATTYDGSLYLLVYFSWIFASVGLGWFLTGFLGFNPYRVAALFSALAVAQFYWFAAPILCQTASDFMHMPVHEEVIFGVRALGFLIAATLLYRGLRNEGLYERGMAAAAEREKASLLAHNGAKFAVTETSSRTQMAAPPEQTLLSVMLAAGLEVNANCHSGLCGADPFAIIDGAGNLSPTPAWQP